MALRNRMCRRGCFSALTAVLLLCLAAPALAEPVHVSAQADEGLPRVQARQQILERALAAAVFQEAQGLLPGPVPAARIEALRQYLSPHSLDLVQSYQETPTAKAAQSEAAAPQDAAQSAPLVLDFDVEVNRAALRQMLVRLGFFAGAKHPRTFVLRLGQGVTEQGVKVLQGQNVLLGLTRAAQAPVEVTLEKLPQGYLKAVLRSGTDSLAADAGDLPGLWLEAWGRFFAGRGQQAGAGARLLLVSGFATVDAVQEFSRTLAGWDDAVQDAAVATVGLAGGGISARFAVRVVSQDRLDAHLKDYLPGRRLTAVVQEPGVAQ